MPGTVLGHWHLKFHLINVSRFLFIYKKMYYLKNVNQILVNYLLYMTLNMHGHTHTENKSLEIKWKWLEKHVLDVIPSNFEVKFDVLLILYHYIIKFSIIFRKCMNTWCWQNEFESWKFGHYSICDFFDKWRFVYIASQNFRFG